MSGVLIATGICPTENCPSDKFMILYWIGDDHLAFRALCKVCENAFDYELK